MRTISTLPRSRAPSSIANRGVRMLPCTRLASPRRKRSPALRFPCTVPSITISRASISACTRPFGPTVTHALGSRIFPCVSPSIYKFEVPEISPLIFNPAEIVVVPLGAEAVTEFTLTGACGVGGVAGVLTGCGCWAFTDGAGMTGTEVSAACEDGLASADLFHIKFSPRMLRFLRRAARVPSDVKTIVQQGSRVNHGVTTSDDLVWAWRGLCREAVY